MDIVKKYSMFFSNTYGNLTIFSYRYIDPTIFELHPIAREIRGLIFDTNGKLVARPYHKFFNIGEPNCTVTIDDIGTAVHKIDGSMLTAFLYEDTLHFASKGSFDSWVVESAKTLEINHIEQLTKEFKGHTVIFELVDPENSIVIRPEKKDLILTGIRDNIKGTYLSPEKIIEIAQDYKLSYPNIMFKDLPITEIIEKIVPMTEIEGVVVHTNKDLCKIKTEWYLQRHKIITNLTEKNILKAYADNTLDDVYVLLDKANKQYVNHIVHTEIEKIKALVVDIKHFFETHSFDSAKDLGLYLQGSPIPKEKWSIYFNVYHRKCSIDEAVYLYFKNRWKKGIV